MYPSSHSRAALSSPWSVSFVTFSGRRTPGPTAHRGLALTKPASEGRPSKGDNHHKMYFSWLLESLENPSGCVVLHIVMSLTWLLESHSECEIAHMVPRAGTLVPISESETKLTYQVPGFSQHRRCVIARRRLRGRCAHTGPSGAPPQASKSPLRGPQGPSR